MEVFVQGKLIGLGALLVALSMGTACEKKEEAPASTDGAVAEAPVADGEAKADGASGEEAPAAAAPKTPVMPQDESKAATPPTKEDLAAFTSDLGEGKLRAKIHTNMGALNCELYEKESPITVANFVGLARGLKAWTEPKIDRTKMPPVSAGDVKVNTPLYSGVICHRVIPNFMIQCGDPSGTGMGNPGYQIPDEFGAGLKHDKPGLLSMANAGPGTGGSQFFITEVPTPHLDNRHTIFGACEEVETVKKIARVERGAMDKPVNDVIIEKIEIYRGDKK